MTRGIEKPPVLPLADCLREAGRLMLCGGACGQDKGRTGRGVGKEFCAPPSGKNASAARLRRDRLWPYSFAHSPCRLQYANVLTTLSPSASAKTAFGASPGARSAL